MFLPGVHPIAFAAILMVSGAGWPLPLIAAERADAFGPARKQMIEEQIKARGITNKAVLDAMLKVPRHRFVPREQQANAYRDQPLPIGHNQTISQPYIVALMTELLDIKPGQKVLEIGAGSGYQAAILAQITTNVYTIEIVQPLAEQARKRLVEFGLREDQVIHGDGYKGLPTNAPFHAIIVTAAPETIPSPLLEQLAPGGRMVIPVGPLYSVQNLQVVQKDQSGKISTRNVAPVSFVPMTGGAKPKP